MRADRLVSLVLLLRQRGRLSATAIARELEVSTRTVLRDIEALSSAGIPIYADRGRYGGFCLLPGFRTELTGLNDDEALALLVGASPDELRLGPALAAARRKVLDALPAAGQRAASEGARRLLIEPQADLLARQTPREQVPEAVLAPVRRAVVCGHKLRIEYAAAGQSPRWRTVDPLGLVTVRGIGYLLATRSGADRTYRLSRVRAADVLPEPAERPADVDLDRIWRERSARFRGRDPLRVVLRVRPARRADVVATAVDVLCEDSDAAGWLRLEVSFQDERHAVWALWQLGLDAEALAPQSLRDVVRDRALAIAQHYDS